MELFVTEISVINVPADHEARERKHLKQRESRIADFDDVKEEEVLERVEGRHEKTR